MTPVEWPEPPNCPACGERMVLCGEEFDGHRRVWTRQVACLNPSCLEGLSSYVDTPDDLRVFILELAEEVAP